MALGRTPYNVSRILPSTRARTEMRRFNGHHWKDYVENLVTPDYQRFGDVVRTRILPVFDGINKEADDLAKHRYDELMSSVVPHEDWDDGGAIADLAMEAGYDHYDMLLSMRSATLNLYAAALYHLTEQHIVDLCVMILDNHQRSEIPPAEAIKWFKNDVGLDLKSLPSWLSASLHRRSAPLRGPLPRRSLVPRESLPNTRCLSARTYTQSGHDHAHIGCDRCRCWMTAVRDFQDADARPAGPGCRSVGA